MAVSRSKIIKLVETDLNKVLQANDLQFVGFEQQEALQNKDDTTKFLIKDSNSKNVAFLLCSDIEFGDIPMRNLNKSAEIKNKLLKNAGFVVLEPLMFGQKGGICYVVWPYCKPLESQFLVSQIQLFKLKPLVLNWLRGVTEESLCKLEQIDVDLHFTSSLKRFSVRYDLEPTIKDAVNTQVESLEQKKWLPYFVLAHNDLWIGNILINKKNKHNGLAIIDWASAHYKSFAIYDLVRLSMSLKLSKRAFRKELQAHCQILQCDINNSMGYLLASLAFLSENLDQFPEDRFLNLVSECFEYMDQML